MSIAKIKLIDSARATLQYAVGKKGTRVIGGDAVPWVERDDLSDEQLRQIVATATHKLMVSIDLNDRVKRSVGHTSIAFPPGEDLDDQQLSEYCEKYLAAMILTSERPELLKNFDPHTFRAAVQTFREQELPKYSYSVVRHTDEPHPHAHIVYSRINLETERAISNSYERYRSQEILRDLERQYKLQVLPNSWEVGCKAQSISQLQKEAKTGEISIQKQLQDILERVGQVSETMPQLIENLQAEGVEVRMQFTRTGKSRGISYRLNGVGMSGNSLGNRYSFKHSDPGICKAFGLTYDPKRDNDRIQKLCQQQPLNHEQRLLRNDIAASLSSTTAAIQQLDFSPATAPRPTDETGEPGRHPRSESEAASGDRPVAAGDAIAPRIGETDRFSRRDQRTNGQFETTQFPSITSFERAIESTNAGRTSENVRNQRGRLEQQLRDFEQNSQHQIERINDSIADLNQNLERRRANRRLRQQVQVERAEQIAPIAQQLFELYVAQGETAYKETPLSSEHTYRVNLGEICYLVSRDDATMVYNVQREDTNLNLQTCNGITTQDVQRWQSIQGWLDQEQRQLEQPPPTAEALSSPPEPVSLTLEQVGDLSVQEWSQLLPRQQINLVLATHHHRQTEPRVTVQVEQWVGQAAQLHRQLKEEREQVGLLQKTLQELERRGQRSLLNPFGASAEQLSDVRENLRTMQQVLKYTAGELKRIQERQAQRQQQEAACREWATLPQTEGAQRVLTLLQDPELRSQYEMVKRRAGQLWQWEQAAARLEVEPTELAEIHQIGQNYLDGYPPSEEMLRRMQHDLNEYQQQLAQRGYDQER